MDYNKLLLEGQKTLKENNLDQSIAKTFLMESASLTPNSFYTNLTDKPSKKVIKKYRKYLNSYINKDKPLQYLLKKAYFYNLEFFVNKNVLIPRPETEGIIEIFQSYNNSNNYLKVIDIGTGSGCIAVTLANLFPNKNVYAVDKSKKALKVAKRNNQKHQTKVTFMESDLFKNVNEKFDVVIANLPYVATTEMIDEYVLKEPKEALFAGVDGIDLYQEFFSQVFNYVTNNYLIIIEHGYKQKEFIHKIIKEKNNYLNVITLKDLNNKDRYTIINGESNERI